MTGEDRIARVVRDVRATTDLPLEMTFAAPALSVFVDGTHVMRSTVDVIPDVVWMAELLQDQIVIEAIGAAWPRCLRHGRHPMRAVDGPDGDGWWVCPHDDGATVRIGELVPSTALEPVVADDTVRWWLDSGGWGVIAHSDGDVWVPYSALTEDAKPALAEGDRVEWEPDRYGQGAFRRGARNVRRVGAEAV